MTKKHLHHHRCLSTNHFQTKFKLDTLCVSLFHRNGRIGDTMAGTLLHWLTLTSSNIDYYSDLEPIHLRTNSHLTTNMNGIPTAMSSWWKTCTGYQWLMSTISKLERTCYRPPRISSTFCSRRIAVNLADKAKTKVMDCSAASVLQVYPWCLPSLIFTWVQKLSIQKHVSDGLRTTTCGGREYFYVIDW